jgi:signal transduction histidine kinase
MTENPTMAPVPAVLVDGPVPAETAAPAPRAALVRGRLARLGRDTALVLASFPLAIISFVVLVVGLVLAVGMFVTVVGIPIAAGTLAAASGFANVQRRLLAVRGTPLPPKPRPVCSGRRRGLRAMFAQLRSGRRWAEVLHGISALPLAVLTFGVVVAWWGIAIEALAWVCWSRLLPEGNVGLAELLHLPISDLELNLAVGFLLAVTLVPVVRGCADLHKGWAWALLVGTSRRALEERVADLTARRGAAAAAQAQSLRRLERDIHDGPQQRLVRLGMDLSVAQRRLDHDPGAVRELLGQARTQAAEALAELRGLSRGIAPPILTDRGLEAALASITARSPAPTTLDVDLGAGPRPTAAIETAAYFVACEALTNTAKHAAASSAAVRVRRNTGADGATVLRVEVSDDGVGGADLAKGHGLAGLADRVAGLDGTLSVTSPMGGPTLLVAELPC